MNPSFDFILGQPADNVSGRWVEGSVTDKEGAYGFSAKLLLRRGTACSCQPVWLDIKRPFLASEFAALLRLVSSGRWQTVTPVLGLYETFGLDPAAATAIFEAIAEWVYPWEHESVSLLEDLASLGDQLEQVRTKEMLSFAIANFTTDDLPLSIRKGTSTPDGGGK
jgi:hypothetical protein